MHARPAIRPLAAVAAVIVLVLALAACGKDSKSSASSTTKAPASATTAKAKDDDDDAASTVVAKNFSLTSITVKAGSDVYFSNQDSTDHTLTANDGTSFDTGHVAGGKTADFKAPTKAGTYAYHCAIHSSMKGTLTVQ